jgi:microcystin-dependent protein
MERDEMTQQFLAQIQPFGFNFAPKGWAMCNGQILGIAQNTALFSLVGTYYGGNGTTTFGLPNLQSRVPMHQGTSPSGEQFFMGEMAGAENVTLTIGTLPMHNHTFMGANAAGNLNRPDAGSAAANTTTAPADSFYGPSNSNLVPLNPASISFTGGGQAHANIQPYLAINWCIAQVGIYPARN